MVTFHSLGGNGRRRCLWLSVATAAVLLAAAQSTQAAPFAYVTDTGAGVCPCAISQYDAGPAGLLSPLSPPTVATGRSPGRVAVSPDARSVYVTTGAEDVVSQYDVGASGKLSRKSPATVAAGRIPGGVAVSPDGKSVYVTSNIFHNNSFQPVIFQYTVGAGGRLSPKNPARVATASRGDIAASPGGRSVYVANIDQDSVSQYNVGAGGKLSPKNPATVAAGSGPSGVAVSADGRSVYVPNVSSNNVSQYDVGASGKLSPKKPATVAAGSVPQGVAVSPGGGSVYVVNAYRNNVSQYDVGASGKLSPKSPATVATGELPIRVAVSPRGGSVYVTNDNSNTVSQYNVVAGGKLSPKSPAAVATGGGPVDVAVTPPTPGWEGRVTNSASGCSARVQVPYLDGHMQATAYTEVFCPKPTRLTIRSRLRSDYPSSDPSSDITVAQLGCTGKSSCVVDEPKGLRSFHLSCPKSDSRRHNQRYYSDITVYPGTNSAAATKERSRATSLSPFCAQ